MRPTIKIAYHQKSKTFKHIDSIDNAYKGLLCGCACLKCNENLVAVVDVKKRIKHFRHLTNITCEGSQETALHELGKQILLDNTQIILPLYGTIIYHRAAAEQPLENKRPDVSAIFDNLPIYFEILVTNALDNDRRFFYRNGKHRCVEINLSDCKNSTLDEIKNLVLNEIEMKEVIFWKDEPISEAQIAIQNDLNPLRKIALLGVVFFVASKFISWLLKPKRAYR